MTRGRLENGIGYATGGNFQQGMPSSPSYSKSEVSDNLAPVNDL